MEPTAEPMTRAARRVAAERDGRVLRESRSDRRGERPGDRRRRGTVRRWDRSGEGRRPGGHRAARRHGLGRVRERIVEFARERYGGSVARHRRGLTVVAVGVVAVGVGLGTAGVLGVTPSDVARTPLVRAGLDLLRPLEMPEGPVVDVDLTGGRSASVEQPPTVIDLCVAHVVGELPRGTAGYLSLLASANGSDLDAFCRDRIGATPSTGAGVTE